MADINALSELLARPRVEESLLLPEASGALALDRARRQRLADRWEASAPVE